MSAHPARLLATLSLTAALAGCAQRSAVPFEQGSDRYRFDIGIVAIAGEAGAFSCAARVTDLVSHRAIEAPAVQGRAGAPGKVVKADEGSGAALEVELTVDPDGRDATCAAAVRKGGALIASDTATHRAR